MASRIKGITIEIGGDTTELTKSLQGVDKQVSKTKTELKDVEKLLKLDPENTELLAEKQKLLADSVDLTKERLTKLQEAQEQLKESGKNIGDEEYNKLNREIIETEQTLKKAEKALKDFNAEHSNLKKLADGFSDVSKNADKVAKATAPLSAGAGALVTGLGAMAYKSVQLSDDLNTLAKQSGLTTEEIQKFQFAEDVVDVSADSIIGALSKMRKNMNSTSRMFKVLGNKSVYQQKMQMETSVIAQLYSMKH